MKKMQIVSIFATWVLIAAVIFDSSVQMGSVQDQEEITAISEPLREWREITKAASDPDAFVSVWNTMLTSDGSSASNRVRLPLEEDGTYNFTVAWGDGTNDTITSWNQSEITHTYNSSGMFTLTITGTLSGWQFNYWGDRLKIVEIQQWGALRLGNARGYFYGCENLNLTTTDSLDLTGTTTLFQAFKDCVNLGSSGNLNAWDVSQVTDMWGMFDHASSFNQPLNAWDVSNVTYMYALFLGTTLFNQPLDAWDVSSVVSMNYMFQGASSFNQPLNSWDVSNVLGMNCMFLSASSFNQPLNSWNVSNVGGMELMFDEANLFNQPLNEWDVSSVWSMNHMFYGAISFNQPLDAWDVSYVFDMSNMFKGAISFNQPLDSWDVSSVSTMSYMFYGASSFNHPLNSWIVSSVTIMNYMFTLASSFNHPLDAWDVSSVTDMKSMLYGSSLTTTNYDAMLVSWSQLSLQSGVTFGAGNVPYGFGAAETARERIIDEFSWRISDGGPIIVASNIPVLDAIEGPSTSGRITLVWNPVEGATSYSIYRSSSPITEVSGLTAIVTGHTEPIYLDTGLTNGTYYYVVVASFGEVASPISNCESVVVVLSGDWIDGYPLVWSGIMMLGGLIGVVEGFASVEDNRRGILFFHAKFFEYSSMLSKMDLSFKSVKISTSQKRGDSIHEKIT